MSASCPKCGFSPDAEVTARWAFRLDKRIESANTRTVNAGASRWRYAKARDEWQWLVKLAALAVERSGLIMARPSSKRRVTITRHYAGRCQEMDRDNLVAGCKALVDAMVREGVVHDDKREYLELHVLQERWDSNETCIVVEELA